MDNRKEMKPQVHKQHYFTREYETKERFITYWHQIHEAMLLNPRSILEIGVGNKFVSNYLRERGFHITTLDLDVELKPCIVASVLKIPVLDQSFEVTTCYQLLEHLPYDEFKNALEEIARVSVKNIVISLPDVTTIYRFNIELPRLKPIKKLIPHPFPRSKQHKSDGQHFWEIGWQEYPLTRIISDIKHSKLNILKTYRVHEFYYHRFFILETL
jgi:hypothetical protein